MSMFSRWWATNTALKITGAAVAGALVVGGGTLAAVKGIGTNSSTDVGQKVGTSLNGNGVGAGAGASAGKGSVNGSAAGSAYAGGSSAGAGESIGATVPSPGSLLPSTSPLPKPTSLVPSVNPTSLVPSVNPTSLVPSVNPTSLVPSVNPTSLVPSSSPPSSPTPLPSSSPLPNLGVPIPVPTVGVNGLSPYASGFYSVPVPATPSHTAHLCLGVDDTTNCRDLVVPSEGGMTLTLAFSANTSFFAPTYTVNACGTGTGYTLTLAGTTPGTAISATIHGLSPVENATQGTSKSILASLCVS